MRDYVEHSGCLMEFLAEALDDPDAKPCGICTNCQGKGFPAAPSGELAAEARAFLGGEDLLIEPRKMWPTGALAERGSKIPDGERALLGRCLGRSSDLTVGRLVRDGKFEADHFADELVDAAADFVARRWRPAPAPAWVTAVPSPRRPALVWSFAERLAAKLGLPAVPALRVGSAAPEQRTMANSAFAARNASDMLDCDPRLVRPSAVLLVDDMIDSGWTLTAAAVLLRRAKCPAVHPFALARTTSKDG